MRDVFITSFTCASSGTQFVIRLLLLFCIRGIIKLLPSHLSLDDDLVGSLLLLRLAEDVYGPPGLVGSVWDVEAARLVLADLLNLLEVVVGELDLLEVVADAAGSDGLGDDGVTANLGPGEDDLCGGGTDAVGDLLDGLVGDEQGLTDHVVTEGRVLGDVDTLLTHPLDEVGLEEARVALDLVGGGCDASLVDQSLEVLLCVVGDTNSAGLLLVELGHGLPCVDNGDRVEHLDITVGLKREKVLVNIALLVESNGEVDKVKVEVVEAKLSKAVVEGRSDIVGPVLRVPELGCDEEVLTLDTLAESLLEGLSNLLLVAINLGKVNVLVAGLESLVDGGLNLARLSLPCSKTQLAVTLSVLNGRLLVTGVLTGWRRRC
jgi:hypothetical protein